MHITFCCFVEYLQPQTSWPLLRASLRPAPQALLPRASVHAIDVRIREDHTAPALHPGLPVKPNGRKCYSTWVRVTPMRNRKVEDIFCH